MPAQVPSLWASRAVRPAARRGHRARASLPFHPFRVGPARAHDHSYDSFDAVVLLSAPAEVLLGRTESRTTNTYGKTSEDRELILRHLAEVEPLLRRTCSHEIDATRALASIVDQLAELGREAPA